jgi:hypothetical protein
MLSRPMLRSRVVLNAHVWGRSWRAYVAQVKSALPRGADIAKAECQVRLVPKADVVVTAVRPGAAEQQKYRNGFEIDDHLSVRSPLLLSDRTSEACCSFAS